MCSVQSRHPNASICRSRTPRDMPTTDIDPHARVEDLPHEDVLVREGAAQATAGTTQPFAKRRVARNV